MMIIDPHAHMISRTTDDYQAMAEAGVVAVVEPAFWIGQPRTHPETYEDYLAHLVGFERFRAGQFGIRHYCAVGLNAKEANQQEFAETVMEFLPRFAAKDGVVAIGEIGFDEQTAAEERYFRLQLDLARELDLPVMVHTPHRDKRQGTLRSMAICREHGLSPSRVVIDHNNEGTVETVLDNGFWAAFSIYPSTKMGSVRMVDILARWGGERIIMDSACDWGISDPLAVAKTARLAVERGVPDDVVRQACYDNALAAYGQSGQMRASDWIDPPAVDQRTIYEGNSILRGGRDPVIEDVARRRSRGRLVE